MFHPAKPFLADDEFGSGGCADTRSEPKLRRFSISAPRGRKSQPMSFTPISSSTEIWLVTEVESINTLAKLPNLRPYLVVVAATGTPSLSQSTVPCPAPSTARSEVAGFVLQRKLRRWSELAPPRLKPVGVLAHSRCHHLSWWSRIPSILRFQEMKSRVWAWPIPRFEKSSPIGPLFRYLEPAQYRG
ncbi:unnamed protein product [Arabis nemorensis]|uniref:Uncharacterized protein n=1 Tax=Arabis nemorensis TaxID=586526 RepID=A0A565CAT1_9BRAS|nr:unnamed protein product [Arabis nemorensis]